MVAQAAEDWLVEEGDGIPGLSLSIPRVRAVRAERAWEAMGPRRCVPLRQA